MNMKKLLIATALSISLSGASVALAGTQSGDTPPDPSGGMSQILSDIYGLLSSTATQANKLESQLGDKAAMEKLIANYLS